MVVPISFVMTGARVLQADCHHETFGPLDHPALESGTHGPIYKRSRVVMVRKFVKLCLLICTLVLDPLAAGPGQAAVSDGYASVPLTAKLITAQDGVDQETGTLTAGLHLKLGDGWKTYWKSPGEVGIPPKVSWDGSRNVRDVQFNWPAPIRFRAFGIENFGYKDEVVFPLTISLEEPGAPVDLQADVSVLVCSDVCVPVDFPLTLSLPQGSGKDLESARLINAYMSRVPSEGNQSGMESETASLDAENEALTLTFSTELPFAEPDVFPDMGPDMVFGAPDIRLDQNGQSMWVRFPILSMAEAPPPLSVTVTDTNRVAEFFPDTSDAPALPPYEIAPSETTAGTLIWILLLAVGGGLVLNVMPCVLPVLSIKLSSAVKAQDRSVAHIRAGFLASAAGILAFMWLLAGVTIAARSLGFSIGWGIQFQSPVFLAVMIVVLGIFSANLAGLFEISLPQSLNTRLTQVEGGRAPLVGDFLTGAFSAILATPCSAPFLGTAVAFALTGRPMDILAIFSALGLGLALPYLLVALHPKLIAVLPRPGRWMVVLKAVLSAALIATTAWLIWVMIGVAGMIAAMGTTAAVAVLVLVIWKGTTLPPIARWTALTLPLVAALAVPIVLCGGRQPTDVLQEGESISWVAFNRSEIAQLVSQGQVVFVDVTADWCLTCKANKALVMERGEVLTLLQSGKVVPMQADWTRPDEKIARFLEDNGRFGIPFNIVYGPSAPEGIALPEILTSKAILDAVERAAPIVSAAGE